jgi:Cu/Ag efflux protein CusF
MEGNMTAKSLAILAGALWLFDSAGPAQTVTKAQSVTATATIQAIDSATRTITLRNDKGEEDSFVASPALQRFDELKVGQKVKATYYESMVFTLRKPGETPDAKSDEAALARAKSGLPAGAVAREQKMTVTVKSIDPAVPSITVTTPDGRMATRKIEDKTKLAQVKVGDKIDITYTQALIVSIEPAK